MLRKITVFCVTILVYVSIVPVFGQSDANVGNTQPGAVAPDTRDQNSNLLQSDLSSSAKTPCTVVGTTTDGFENLIYVNIKATGTSADPYLVGSPTTGTIYWGSGASCTTATTCTIIFSNPPPAPAWVQLSSTSITTAAMDVFNSPLVIFSSDTKATDWFPAGSPNLVFDTMILSVSPSQQWYSVSKDAVTGTYPSLQWQPGTVTIIYQ